MFLCGHHHRPVHLTFTWRLLEVYLVFTWRLLDVYLTFTWRSSTMFKLADSQSRCLCLSRDTFVNYSKNIPSRRRGRKSAFISGSECLPDLFGQQSNLFFFPLVWIIFIHSARLIISPQYHCPYNITMFQLYEIWD